jgi:hypothetical protein
MALPIIIEVANPSTYDRSDYVEVDLASYGVTVAEADQRLRLFRIWSEEKGHENKEEIAYQIDRLFGVSNPRRVLTFISSATPRSKKDNYKKPGAKFRLEVHDPAAGDPPDEEKLRAAVHADLLKIEHYTTSPGCDSKWDPAKDVIGVKLFNGGELPPLDHRDRAESGLQVYFSLVARPDQFSPFNYVGAATSVLHHRAWKHDPHFGEILVAPMAFRDHAPQKRWGQLTSIEFYSLPWERRWYQSESLLGKPGNEPRYTLAWSQTGPLRATVTLKSKPIQVRCGGGPFFQPRERTIPCCLYRVISLYPKREFYTEQLFINVEGEGIPELEERVSLAFRAWYHSYVDYPPEVSPVPARLSEDIPDYFAVWRQFSNERRGYAFACDSHVRNFILRGAETTWRLQLGHDHRSVHAFPFHPAPTGIAGGINPLQEVGHTAWYEWLYKPLQAIPLKRYVMRPEA